MRIFQHALLALSFSFVATQSNAQLAALDGNWYSTQWKYGYVLKDGLGVATSTNSPNFQVGQNIIQLTATSPNTFTGQQVYKDGKFYRVDARLQADGRLYFEGEKNAKWIMDRVVVAPQKANNTSNDTKNQLIGKCLTLLVGCGADEKLIGTWKRNVQGPKKNGVGFEFVQTCSFSKNNTNTCENEHLTNAYSGKVSVKYVTTQEWQINKNVLTLKNIDAKIREIRANGTLILPSEPLGQSVVQNTLSNYPNGKTTTTKIEFKNNMFELIFDNNSKAQFYKVQ